MTLITQYEQAVLQGDIEDNPQQRHVLISLQDLARQLETSQSWWARWRRLPIKGIYLYGPVGVGKTFLIDLFYQSLSYQRKTRFHFHHFMQQVDAQLRRLQGEKNPLQKIAADFAKSSRLLCFDEFMVDDVAYAMILADLLKALLAEGVILVMTSNIPPDDLYLNGVQRHRFLPAIELIKAQTSVLHLENSTDYRLGRAPLHEAYLYPLNNTSEQKMEALFNGIASEVRIGGEISIQNRKIPFIKCAKRAIWFDFFVICALPRSQLDYLEIAERFDTVFISGMPILKENDTLPVILLIQMIDVFYDRGIRLVLSAEGPLEGLYLQGEMRQEFKRTQSRLQEMQSADYLRRHPRRQIKTF